MNLASGFIVAFAIIATGGVALAVFAVLHRERPNRVFGEKEPLLDLKKPNEVSRRAIAEAENIIQSRRQRLNRQ